MNVRKALSLGMPQALWEVAQLDARASHPGGKHKRKSGQLFPCLAQIELILEAGWLLDGDVETVVASAARCWDLFAASPAVQQSSRP